MTMSTTKGHTMNEMLGYLGQIIGIAGIAFLTWAAITRFDLD